MLDAPVEDGVVDVASEALANHVSGADAPSAGRSEAHLKGAIRN